VIFKELPGLKAYSETSEDAESFAAYYRQWPWQDPPNQIEPEHTENIIYSRSQFQKSSAVQSLKCTSLFKIQVFVSFTQASP
jgi:hypothetical protein